MENKVVMGKCSQEGIFCFFSLGLESIVKYKGQVDGDSGFWRI